MLFGIHGLAEKIDMTVKKLQSKDITLKSQRVTTLRLYCDIQERVSVENVECMKENQEYDGCELSKCGKFFVSLASVGHYLSGKDFETVRTLEKVYENEKEDVSREIVGFILETTPKLVTLKALQNADHDYHLAPTLPQELVTLNARDISKMISK